MIQLLSMFALLNAAPAHTWRRIGTLPSSSRAFAVIGPQAIIGFSADRTTASVFTLTLPEISRSAPLPKAPPFYASAYDATSGRLCLPLATAAGGVELACFDASLRATRSPIGIPMTSGAFLGADLWAIDPSGQFASKRTSLVRLRSTAAGWAEVKRVTSPLCSQRDSDLECGELEVHPAGKTSLALVPLLGRFDGERLIYPAMGVWNSATNALRRVNAPPLTVEPALREAYRSLGGHPLRVVYRSAASERGELAIIPALPAPGDQPVKRNELWLFDVRGELERIPAPAQLNAVTFDGNDPIVVTAEGAVLRWKR